MKKEGGKVTKLGEDLLLFCLFVCLFSLVCLFILLVCLFVFVCLFCFVRFLFLFLFLFFFLFCFVFFFLFIFLFVCFFASHFSKPLKFVLGLPKWKFSTGKKAFHSGEKIKKNDFAPSKKFSCYAPAQNVLIWGRGCTGGVEVGVVLIPPPPPPRKGFFFVLFLFFSTNVFLFYSSGG